MKKLRFVEIEIHSHCNRKCSWCPNSLLSREFFEILPFSAFESAITALKRMDFRGYISFSRYNEPTWDLDLLGMYVQHIRESELPVKVVFNTNGDFLDIPKIREISVDELTIMDYDCRGVEHFLPLFKKLGLTDIREDDTTLYGRWEPMEILVSLNWPEHALIENRGGILRQGDSTRWKNGLVPRDYPCNEPELFIAVDYNGSVMPCCHLRSDFPEHREFILGNIKEQDLDVILTSPKAGKIRENLKSIISEGKSGPCSLCHKEGGRYTRENPGILYTST